LWNEKVAGIAGADFNNISFGTKAFDFFFENYLRVGHGSQR